MAFADPQSVTYNGTAYNLPRISSGVNSGRFQVAATSTLGLTLDISHSYGKRTRRVARLTADSINANPYATGVSVPQSSSFYLVCDTPADLGVVDPAVAVLGINALTLWFTATTNANALRVAQGQN